MLRHAHGSQLWYDEASRRAGLGQRVGFTLVELMFVMTILTVILGGLLTSFLIGRSSYMTSDAYIQVQQEARRALDIMGKELRAARSTVAVSGNPAGSQVNFQVALGYDLATAGCTANAVCWGAQDLSNVNQPDWSIQYRLVGTQLVRELVNGALVVAGSQRVIANSINAAAAGNQPIFAYDPISKTVAIALDVRQVSNQLAGGSMSTSPLTTRVRLRNN
jgi:type II secretory pathway pseudopilin PulG